MQRAALRATGRDVNDAGESRRHGRTDFAQVRLEFVRSGDTLIVTGLDQRARLHDQERLGPSAIASRLGVGPASVCRVLGKGAA